MSHVMVSKMKCRTVLFISLSLNIYVVISKKFRNDEQEFHLLLALNEWKRTQNSKNSFRCRRVGERRFFQSDEPSRTSLLDTIRKLRGSVPSRNSKVQKGDGENSRGH